jgi:hypothetical protein
MLWRVLLVDDPKKTDALTAKVKSQLSLSSITTEKLQTSTENASKPYSISRGYSDGSILKLTHKASEHFVKFDDSCMTPAPMLCKKDRRHSCDLTVTLDNIHSPVAAVSLPIIAKSPPTTATKSTERRKSDSNLLKSQNFAAGVLRRMTTGSESKIDMPLIVPARKASLPILKTKPISTSE